MEQPILLRAAWLWDGTDTEPRADGRVLVRDGRIAALGEAATAAAGARVIDLGGAVLMPGLVCAHQHGRGLSQLLLGYPDDRLEAWSNRRRKRGAPASYPLVRLAAARMLRHGITGCIHANWSYGGPQAEELPEVMRAYADAGIRAAICVGVADRGAMVLPEEDLQPFLAGLPTALRALAGQVSRHPFIADAAEAAALLDALAGASGPRISWLLGPAAPHWVSDGLMAELAAAAADRRIGLHYHLLESPVQRDACARLYPEGTVRRLLTLGALGPRHSAAHGVFLSPDDMALLAESGTTLVLNPGSNMRLGNGPPQVAALMRVGVPLALGGDDCELADDRDPWGELRLVSALSRGGDQGSPPGLSPAGLLRIATSAGRRLLGQPGQAVLAVGEPADVMALDPGPRGDADLPLSALLTGRARGADTRLTMVAGEVLWHAGERRHDLPALEQAALEAAQSAASHATRDAAEVEALGRELLRFYAGRQLSC